MLDESDYDLDSAYTLALPASSRADAASDISIRVDDGADIVIDIGSRTRGHINAYLTMDEAEDLSAALAEILRLPSDRTGALNRTGRIRADQLASDNDNHRADSRGDKGRGDSDDDGVPKLR